MEEDAQPLEQPIIAPIRVKKFEIEERDALKMHAGEEFMAGLMATPHLCCIVAVVGHLHHGKTMVMDMLVKQTHDVKYEWRNNEKELRWTDTRLDEQQRGISIKMTPMTMVMEASSGKSRLFTMLDCPGHVNFNDEVTSALRLADGVLLVIDTVEGVMVVTERAIKQALSEGLPICVMLSKV